MRVDVGCHVWDPRARVRAAGERKEEAHELVRLAQGPAPAQQAVPDLTMQTVNEPYLQRVYFLRMACSAARSTDKSYTTRSHMHTGISTKIGCTGDFAPECHHEWVLLAHPVPEMGLCATVRLNVPPLDYCLLCPFTGYNEEWTVAAPRLPACLCGRGASCRAAFDAAWSTQFATQSCLSLSGGPRWPSWMWLLQHCGGFFEKPTDNPTRFRRRRSKFYHVNSVGFDNFAIRGFGRGFLLRKARQDVET